MLDAESDPPLQPDGDPVRTLFLAARGLPEPERAAYVRASAGPGTPLAAEVLALLAAESRADGAVEALVARAAGDLERATLDLAGTRLGPYTVGERIGEGGFAVVHRAEQSEPVRRSVAIKLLKAGMDSAAILARFEGERQALARLEHPGIARVLDAGVTEHGRPWFAMDLVRGRPITEHADAVQLDIDARLELFAAVCDAVHHAHQRGILHRDLKPANILVSGDDPARLRPTVIDFGIAKALGDPLVEGPSVTGGDQLIGTPGYMSPEQIQSAPDSIDTRTDVYALGVVLHELLLGTGPHRVPPSGTPADLARLAAAPDPSRPSRRLQRLSPAAAAANAAARRTDPRRLSRRLRRDLDWICLTALAVDRDRRYASVSELAADVRRALRGDLVAAGPPTVRYRTGAFIRRRRLEVASAAVVALAAVVATALVGRSAVEAHRARDQQSAVAGFLERFIVTASPFTAGAALPPVPVPDAGGPNAGESRVDTLRGRLDMASAMVDEELAAWPEAAARVRLTLSEAFRGLGDTEAALRESERAIELALVTPSLGPAHRTTLDATNIAGLSLWQLSREADAIALLEPARATASRSLGPADPTTLRMGNNLALAYRAVGRDTDARELHRETLERRERALGADHPDTVTSRSNFARALQAAGRVEEALMLQERVLAAHERTFGRDHPDTLVTVDQLGTMYTALGRHGDAVTMHRRAFEGLTRALGDDHETTLGARYYLASAFGRLGRHEEAESELRAIWTTCEERFGLGDRYAVAALTALADVLRAVGRPGEAAGPLAATLESVSGVHGWAHPRTWSLTRSLVLVHQDEDQHAVALQLLGRILGPVRGELASDDIRRIELEVLQAVSLAAGPAADAARAMPTLQHGTDALLAAGIRTTRTLPRALEALARLHEAAGNTAEATRCRDAAADLTRSAV